MSNYRLYHSPGACSLAPHILLEELGVPFDLVRVTIAEGANRKPEYLAINPRGRLPTLAYRDESGTEHLLTEAIAIMVLLTRRHPDLQLLPEGPAAFARALEWMCWLASTMHQAGARTVFRPERFTTDEAGAPGIAAQGRIAIREGYAEIEQRLRGRTWTLGDRYSAVDGYLLVFYRWGNRCGLDMRRDFPEYARVMDAVRLRPAVQRAVAHEAVEID